jgi:short-subunit dehydrogenase
MRSSSHRADGPVRPGSIEQGLNELGPYLDNIDILINNAGQLAGGLLETQTAGEIYNMLNVNLLAPIHLIRRLLPSFLTKDETLIVNNTSVNAILHAPCATTYAGAKAGLLAFSDALRRELRGTGIRLLTLLTPAIDTSMLRKAIELYRGHLEVDRWSVAIAIA